MHEGGDSEGEGALNLGRCEGWRMLSMEDED